jgi:hypothetical protein
MQISRSHDWFIELKRCLDEISLAGVIKALLGDRAKVKVDPVVIVRDQGLIGSTSVRFAGAVIKVTSFWNRGVYLTDVTA